MPGRPEDLVDHRRRRRARSRPRACAARCSAGSRAPSRRRRCAGGSADPPPCRSASPAPTISASSFRNSICWPSVETPRSKASVPIATFQPSPGAPTMFSAARARAVEEHLEELGVAGDLQDRADLDAGLLHRHQQVREPLVALRRGIGAADDEAPVRPRGPGGPHLLAVDAPTRRPRGGRASARWRDPSRRSAPSSPGTRSPRRRTIGGRKRRFCASLPKAISVGPSSVSPMWFEAPGRAGARVLLEEDHLLRQRRAAAAVLASASRRRSSRPRRACAPRRGARRRSAASSPGPPRPRSTRTRRRARRPARPRPRGGRPRLRR